MFSKKCKHQISNLDFMLFCQVNTFFKKYLTFINLTHFVHVHFIYIIYYFAQRDINISNKINKVKNFLKKFAFFLVLTFFDAFFSKSSTNIPYKKSIVNSFFTFLYILIYATHLTKITIFNILLQT